MAGHGSAWPTKSLILAPEQELTTTAIFQIGRRPLLDPRTEKEHCSLYVLKDDEEEGMLKVFVEEAAALASIVLFVGMIAVWAQLLPQL